MKKHLFLLIAILACSFAQKVDAQVVLSDSCELSTISFTTDTVGVDSILWNFGDPLSGTADTSTAYLPTHTFSDSGIFIIQVDRWIGGVLTQIFDTVYIYPPTFLVLPNDTNMCLGNSFTLDVAQAGASYLWQDGSTASSFLVNADTMLYITVFGVCDTLNDSVTVSIDFPFAFDLGPDSSYCEGQQVILDANLNATVSALWNTNQSVDSISVSTSGQYILSASNTCDTLIDTINIDFIPLPVDSMLPPDTVNCFNTALVLQRPNESGVQYFWTDSSTSINYTVDTTEQVLLTAINQCGVSIDTMNVVFNGEITADLGNDTIICELDSIQLVATQPGASYLWNTGQTQDTIFTNTAASANYIVTITLGQCQKVAGIKVTLREDSCLNIDCELSYDNVLTPNGDGINDIWRVSTDCEIYKFDLSIYNRWGQLIHYGTNASFGWDGTIQGEKAPAGVYFFQLTFKDYVVVDVDNRDFKGSITLLR